MFKLILVGVWVCLVTLASSYATTYFRASFAKGASEQGADSIETRKTKEINIPKIADGAVKGYVIAQLVYTVSTAEMRKLPVPPDAFVVDEAFQYIYDDEKIDFAHLDRIELDKMTQALILKVNARLRANVITEMGVLECNFLLNAEAKSKL